jgi:hypothetical protein
MLPPPERFLAATDVNGIDDDAPYETLKTEPDAAKPG